MDTLDLLTYDEGKQAVSQPTSRAGNDDTNAVLEQAITAVSRLLDDLCGPIVIREITETVTPYLDVVLLKQYPVDAITSVTEYVSGTGTLLTGGTISSAGDYVLDASIGKLSRLSSFTAYNWLGQAVVVYTAGRFTDTASVDAKFKRCATEILIGGFQKYGAAWARGGDPLADPQFFDEVSHTVQRWLSYELKPAAVA